LYTLESYVAIPRGIHILGFAWIGLAITWLRLAPFARLVWLVAWLSSLHATTGVVLLPSLCMYRTGRIWDDRFRQSHLHRAMRGSLGGDATN
jgi:hypothetical protein